jgi:hypothetical protein
MKKISAAQKRDVDSRGVAEGAEKPSDFNRPHEEFYRRHCLLSFRGSQAICRMTLPLTMYTTISAILVA